MTNVNWFRVFAVLTVLSVGSVLLAFVITAHLFPQPAIMAYTRLALSSMAGLVVGIGLLPLRKWAALSFSVVSLALAVQSLPVWCSLAAGEQQRWACTSEF